MTPATTGFQRIQNTAEIVKFVWDNLTIIVFGRILVSDKQITDISWE